MASEIVRRIHFFRVKIRPNYRGELTNFSIRDACEQIRGLAFDANSTGPESRYLVGRDEDERLCVWPIRVEPSVRIIMGAVRRNDLPSLENDGQITPIALKGNGLVELSHVVFFDRGIVGYEFNSYGPRMANLPGYLSAKCRNGPPVRIDPILNRDAEEKFSRLQDIRGFKLRLHRSQFELLREAGLSIDSALDSAANQYGSDEIELVLRPGHGHRGDSLARSAFSLVGNLLKAQGTINQ